MHHLTFIFIIFKKRGGKRHERKKKSWPRGAMRVWLLFCWDSCLGQAFFIFFFIGFRFKCNEKT